MVKLPSNTNYNLA